MVGIEIQHTVKRGLGPICPASGHIEVGRQEPPDAAVRSLPEPLGHQPGGLVIATLVPVPVGLAEKGGRRGRLPHHAGDAAPGSFQKRREAHRPDCLPEPTSSIDVICGSDSCDVIIRALGSPQILSRNQHATKAGVLSGSQEDPPHLRGRQERGRGSFQQGPSRLQHVPGWASLSASSTFCAMKIKESPAAMRA